MTNKMIKLSYADLCEMMEDSYINRPDSTMERLDFAMLAFYHPEIYDSYVHDFVKTKKQEGKLHEDNFNNYYVVNIENNELLYYTNPDRAH